MSEKKEVYMVTHGEKCLEPNPKMTDRGFGEIEKLRSYLPKNPTTVVCGTGSRQSDVARALELKPSRYTPLAGGAESGEKALDGSIVVVLANGVKIPFSEYTGIEDMVPSAMSFVLSLPHQAIVCAGRELPTMVGAKGAKSATVYKISHDGEKILATEVISA